MLCIIVVLDFFSLSHDYGYVDVRKYIAGLES